MLDSFLVACVVNLMCLPLKVYKNVYHIIMTYIYVQTLKFKDWVFTIFTNWVVGLFGNWV